MAKMIFKIGDKRPSLYQILQILEAMEIEVEDSKIPENIKKHFKVKPI